jgi:hypothetical protein
MSDASEKAESGTAGGLRLCVECAEVYPGDLCPTHTDEPLLDPTDDEVLHLLIGLDDRRRRLIQGGFAFVGGLMGGAVGIGIIAITAALPVSPLIVVALAVAAGAMGGGAVGRKVFRPRFARWTSEDEEAGEAQTAGPPWLVLGVGGAVGVALGFWIGPTLSAVFPSFGSKLMIGIAAIGGGAAGVGLARFGYSTLHTLRHLAPVHAEQMPEGARLCMICARLYQTEHCPVHEFEPLLDPSDAEVRHELVAEEDRQRRRLSGMFAVVIGTSLAVLAGGIASAVGLATTQLLLTAGMGAALGAALGNLVARKLYRPRFAAWTRGIDVADEVDLKDETRALVQGVFGGSGPSWKLVLSCLAGGAVGGAATGALLAWSSVLTFLGPSFSIVLFGFLGLLFGFELSSAVHAERKRLKRLVVALSGCGVAGAGLGIALGVATPWGKLGIPLLALVGGVGGVLVALEVFRVLRKIRKGIEAITD